MTTPPRKPDDVEDTWLLQRDPGESDDDYALRCIALGCAADGTIRLKRWPHLGDDEAIMILLDRLLTGWNPRADEIDRDVLQIDALNWEWFGDGYAIAYLTADRQPCVSGRIIYLDRHLRYALTPDAFLWLRDADESEKILGGQ